MRHQDGAGVHLRVRPLAPWPPFPSHSPPPLSVPPCVVVQYLRRDTMAILECKATTCRASTRLGRRPVLLGPPPLEVS